MFLVHGDSQLGLFQEQRRLRLRTLRVLRRESHCTERQSFSSDHVLATNPILSHRKSQVQGFCVRCNLHLRFGVNRDNQGRFSHSLPEPEVLAEPRSLRWCFPRSKVDGRQWPSFQGNCKQARCNHSKLLEQEALQLNLFQAVADWKCNGIG